jgi:chromosome segregation ATPase
MANSNAAIWVIVVFMFLIMLFFVGYVFATQIVDVSIERQGSYEGKKESSVDNQIASLIAANANVNQELIALRAENERLRFDAQRIEVIPVKKHNYDRCDDLEEDEDDVRDDIDDLEADIKDLEDEIEEGKDNEEDVSDLEDELEELEDELKDLEDDLDDIKDDLDDLDC